MARPLLTSEEEDLEPLISQGFRYAMSLVHDPATAEDLLQDGWLSLLRARGPRTRAYLFRCIRTRYLDRYRRARLVAVEPAPNEELEALADASDSNAPEGSIRAELGDVEKALQKLRPEEREALFLHEVQGYTASEIASLMESPRGTILSLLHRARKKLRAALEPLEVRA